MSAPVDTAARDEVAALRARHPGIAVRVQVEALPAGAATEYRVALDIRGPEFQEIVPGRPFRSMERALAAAFGEAEERLRARAARQRGAMRVVLACQVPEPMELS